MIRRLAWALMALALLTGCAQTRLPTSPSSPPRAVGSDINPHTRDAISDNGELRLAMASWPATWNPLGVDTAGQDRDRERVLEPMTARFFTVTADGTIRHDPNWLAREPSVTTDQRTVVTFSLNPKATWNDGAPITVRDFEATVRACNGSQPDFPCATTEGWDQVESVTAGSTAQEVVVTFRQAYPDWAGLWRHGPLRAESVADAATFTTGWSTLEGKDGYFSGPFMVSGYDAVSRLVTLAPNPHWWGDKPKLSKITFRFVHLESQAQTYINNEIDCFEIGVSTDQLARARQVSTGEVRKAAGTTWRHITLNQQAGLLQDKSVRQAVLLALDRDDILASDLAGLGYSPGVLSNHVFLGTQRQYQDLAQQTGLGYDLGRARKVLDDAGWAVGADGYRAKDGKPLQIVFTQITGIKVSENEALKIQSQLKQVGIKVVIAEFSQSDWDSQVTARKFEMVAFSSAGSAFPYRSLAESFSSHSANNLSSYGNPRVDELINTIAVETDPARRDDYVLEAERLIWDDVQVIPLYQRPDMWEINTKVANFGAFGLATPIWENIGLLK